MKDCLPLAVTPSNIINCFRATSVRPLNTNIFQNSNFAPNFVTDRRKPAKLHKVVEYFMSQSSLEKHPESNNSVKLFAFRFQ